MTLTSYCFGESRWTLETKNSNRHTSFKLIYSKNIVQDERFYKSAHVIFTVKQSIDVFVKGFAIGPLSVLEEILKYSTLTG